MAQRKQGRPVTERGRTRWQWCSRLAPLLILSVLLVACGSLNPMRSRSALIGPRKAVDPMAAAEAYLRQYQPGPLPRLFQTTRFFDRHGTLLAETFGEGRRVWVSLDQISPHLIDATIAVEDSSFYTNSGVDPARIAGAAIKNLQEGQIVSGASTITMQLARNLFLGPEQRYDQSVDRKVLEAGLAQELTDLYNKDELLEMYLNLLNYGQLAYGPEAAAQVYFGKSAADVTAAEATLLAGLPQQPANLNPYDDFEAARARQRIVLDLMVRHEYLTSAEADALFAEPIVMAGDDGLAPNLAPHFVQYLLEELNASYGPDYVQRAGFRIHTSLDLEMQELAEGVVAAKVAEIGPQYDLTNAALVALAPQSGEILVMLGSANFNEAAISGQVNVAVRPRQPGSAIKPILYATALEDNLISPATIVWDIPVTYTVGLPASNVLAQDVVYRPRNYDEQFHGPVTVRTALASSYNIPPLVVLEQTGVPRMLEVARGMGLQSLAQDESWYGLSLTLGGGEVTLLELASAYQTLAHRGHRLAPHGVLEIRDSQDRIVTERAELAVEPEIVLSEETTFVVTDILSDNQARSAAFGPDSPLHLSMPAAAKTGTTSDWRDNWTVGYTPFLVAGVWAGNSDGRPMRNASGLTGAAPIWKAFMEGVISRPAMLAALQSDISSDGSSFVAPDGVVLVDECPPRASCRAGGEYFSRQWLAAAGASGALSDSVVSLPSAPVYVRREDQAWLAGFCVWEGAAERTLLTLADPLGFAPGGLSTSMATDQDSTLHSAAGEGDGQAEAPPLTLDELRSLAWSLRNGAPVQFGPCSWLEARVQAALALEPQPTDEQLRVLIDIAAAGDETIGGFDSERAVDATTLADAVQMAGVGVGGVYSLMQPIVHDRSCPGQYVMGQVRNREGAPVAGVRLELADPWGNRAETASKNGDHDYGHFDFPIYADGPHDLFLTVLDGNGQPLSAPIVIPHKQSVESDAPCHHVVLHGG